MKKVTWTKHRSTKQMINMASNLRERLNCYCCVGYDIDANAHTSDNDSVSINEKYSIYTANIDQLNRSFISWKELLHGYFEIMEK